MWQTKKFYALYSALLSMLSFNFFFTEPYFSLKAYDKGSPVTFAMLFAVGFFMASMTRQLKAQTRESAKKGIPDGNFAGEQQETQALPHQGRGVETGGSSGRKVTKSFHYHLSGG